jgi:fatty acid-binding protein DegV
VSKLLRLSPVLHTTPAGFVKPCGAIFGRSEPRRRFARFVARRLEPRATYRVLVGHGNAESAAHELLRELRYAIEAIGGRLQMAQVLTLGTALGVHGGPGMLVVGVERCAPDVAAGVPKQR